MIEQEGRLIMDTVLQQLNFWSKKKSAKIALIDAGISLTYKDLALCVEFATQFIQQNIADTPGKTAFIFISRTSDALVATLAAQACGLTTLHISDFDSNVFELAKPDLIITNQEEIKHAERRSIVDGFSSIVVIPNTLYNELRETEITFHRRNQASMAGNLLLSSGSTGFPKIIKRSPESDVINTLARARMLKLNIRSRIHNLGYSLSSGSGWANHVDAIYLGATVLSHPKDWIRDAFFNQNISFIQLRPSHIAKLVSLQTESGVSFQRNDRITIMLSGGFISYESVDWIIKTLTGSVFYGGGGTEVGNLFINKVKDRGDLTWLVPTRENQIDIVSENGEVLKDGVEGQMRVKIKEYFPSAYFKIFDPTDDHFKGEYFYTGDLAIKREDGRIRLLGRISETIAYSGGKLPTGPIEQEIAEHLSRSGVFAFSWQNDHQKDEIVVGLEGSEPPSAVELEWLRKKFGASPNLVVKTVEKFPYLSGGKINRTQLRKILLEQNPITLHHNLLR